MVAPHTIAGVPVDKLREEVKRVRALRNFDAAIKVPGVRDRLWHIAEHGASPDDLEWIEQMTTQTGFNFNDAVTACVELHEEY